MSMNFSLFTAETSPLKTSGLARRRQRAFLRKIIIVFCAGIMSLLVISTIISSQATQAIPIAIRHIAQGEHISKNDIQYVQVPQHSVFNHVLSEKDSYKDLVATCDIKAGMPLFRNTTSRSPKIPKGFTALDLNLASADHSLVPGKRITIAFSKVTADTSQAKNGNTEDDQDDDFKEHEGDNQSMDDESNSIDERYVETIRHALVVSISYQQHHSQATLAMPAKDALKVLNAQAINSSLSIVAIRE